MKDFNIDERWYAAKNIADAEKIERMRTLLKKIGDDWRESHKSDSDIAELEKLRKDMTTLREMWERNCLSAWADDTQVLAQIMKMNAGVGNERKEI